MCDKKRKKKRKYEIFEDNSYYNMWCVRSVGDTHFNNHYSWHFPTKKEAKMFLSLIEKAY